MGISVGREQFLERKREWLRKLKEEGKLRDPAEDHRIALKAMQSRMRQEILRYLGSVGRASFEEVAQRFGLDSFQTKIHLDLLEQALFIEAVEEGGKRVYVLTPRGEAYLKNVDWR